MKVLEIKIRALLAAMGAEIISFGNVEGIAPDDYKRVIVAAIPLPLHVLEVEVPDGPTREYVDRYREINVILDEMADKTEELLTAEGYRAYGLSGKKVPWDREAFTTPFPYKTAATRAGIGWVGKCDLLVTPEYGSGIRMTAILTDAPLEYSEPINESRCGSCTECVDICPANAIKNTLWDITKTREDLVEIHRCDEIARDIAEVKLGVRTTMCGKCFAVCPYTQKYIQRKKKEINA